MDNNFWKAVLTLFGIGVMMSFAKSLKSKLTRNEIISECILTGGLSCGAGSIYLVYPNAPLIAVLAIGALASVLGVAFFSQKIEGVIDRFLPAKKVD
jgi:hypothetical protein